MDIFKAAEAAGLLKAVGAGSKQDAIKPADNESNISNGNWGTAGTNRQYDQAQGNRGKQLDPNWKAPAPSQRPVRDDDDVDQGDVYWYSGSD